MPRAERRGNLLEAAVDVAIVNWNTSSEAIASARAYAASSGVDVNVVIFDNASEPEQRSILDEAGGAASVILSDENLGFGTAANRALEDGCADYVLISNADVAPEPNAVQELVKAFATTRDCGLVGPVFEDTANYHDELPGPVTLVIRLLFGNFNRKPIASPNLGATTKVGQVSGACFLTSRNLWESVGGFDERFFLWYEDVDLNKRVQDKNRKSEVVGSARAKHLGGRSFIQLTPRDQQAMRLDSLGLYLRLHHRFFYFLSLPLARIARFFRASKSPYGGPKQ